MFGKKMLLWLPFLMLIFFGMGAGTAEVKWRIDNKYFSQKETASEKTEPVAGETIVENGPVSPEENFAPEETASTSEEPKVEPEEKKFTFAIIGDTQLFKPGIVGGFQLAVGKIKSHDPDLIFAVGDLISDCDKKEECEGKINAWKGTLEPLMKKTYVMQGNHDRAGGEEKKADSIWSNSFSLPANGPAGFTEFAYSFNQDNCHFVVLDSDKPNENEINKTQRDWLEKDLATNRQKYTFVFFHEPAFPLSSKIGESLDKNPGERNALWNILVKHKVKGVFVGHEHITSRKKINGVYQFGFGNTESFDHEMPPKGVAEFAYQGQTYGLIEVGKEKVTVKVFSVNGKLLNNFEF